MSSLSLSLDLRKIMSKFSYSQESGKKPKLELSGSHVRVHGANSRTYQPNPAYNVVTPETGKGAIHLPVYQEVQTSALSIDGSNPVQMVMSTPNVVCKELYRIGIQYYKFLFIAGTYCSTRKVWWQRINGW